MAQALLRLTRWMALSVLATGCVQPMCSGGFQSWSMGRQTVVARFGQSVRESDSQCANQTVSVLG